MERGSCCVCAKCAACENMVGAICIEYGRLLSIAIDNSVYERDTERERESRRKKKRRDKKNVYMGIVRRTERRKIKEAEHSSQTVKLFILLLFFLLFPFLSLVV